MMGKGDMPTGGSLFEEWIKWLLIYPKEIALDARMILVGSTR